MGFANEDGSPTDIYVKFRNSSTRGRAAAEALLHGYSPLYVRNEYMHQLDDKSLRGLIIEETGLRKDSTVVGLVVSAINTLNGYADFDAIDDEQKEKVSAAKPKLDAAEMEAIALTEKQLGLNVSYTINLNLPATSDVAVFNAIFKSLKENLLRDADE